MTSSRALTLAAIGVIALVASVGRLLSDPGHGAPPIEVRVPVLIGISFGGLVITLFAARAVIALVIDGNPTLDRRRLWFAVGAFAGFLVIAFLFGFALR